MGKYHLTVRPYTYSDSQQLCSCNKEFQLLELIMRIPVKIISAEQFMDKDLGALRQTTEAM